MALTKKDIALSIHNKIGLSKTQSSKFLDSFFSIIKTQTVEKGIVKLTHFGTFKTREKKERLGRNPKTKQSAVISSRKVVQFSANSKLRNSVNKTSK